MDTFNTKTRVLAEEELPGNVPDGDGGELATLPVKPQERYKFIRTIGFGGMKGVLLVFDQDTGREIAMAIMPDFRERPKADLERFVREAKLTAKLEHPNIVPVHDIGIDASGSPYFTMKYLHGQSLAAMLRKLAKGDPETVSHYGLARMLQIFIRICNAIEFAHSQGICHLDLKPENVNLGDFGEVLVLDWGLARSLRPAVFGGIYAPNDLDQPPAGRVKGTPGYMAPEQIRSSSEFPVDNRAGQEVYRCALSPEPKVVSGEYEAGNNTTRGTASVILEYSLGSDLSVTALRFNGLSEAFEGKTDAMGRRLSAFRGTRALYNYTTSSYDTLSSSMTELSGEGILPYLSPSNTVTVRYIPDENSSEDTLMFLPVLMVTGVEN